MQTQLLVMLEMQDAMNSRVNPDWRQADNAWYRAIWTECAEMLDHYGWKWWKHQQPDLEQVQLIIGTFQLVQIGTGIFVDHRALEMRRQPSGERGFTGRFRPYDHDFSHKAIGVFFIDLPQEIYPTTAIPIYTR